MQYQLLMFISRVICLLPHSVLLAIGKGLGIVYNKFIKKQRELAVMQMMRGLSLSEKETRELVKQSFINMGRTVLEIMYMPHLTKENYTNYIEIENLERVKMALAEKKGVVVLTAHVGNWEWLSAAFSFAGLPVTAIAKPQPNEQHTRVLNTLRASTGAEIFSRGTSELLGAARALKKGKLLGFLSDQDGGPGGAFVDFLGKMASTPMGAAVFSKKFNSPILPAFILRKPNGMHKIIVGEIMHYEDHGDSDKDLYDLTVKMTRIVEKIIRENPTQWLWFQKRWNTPPNEKKEKHHIV